MMQSPEVAVMGSLRYRITVCRAEVGLDAPAPSLFQAISSDVDADRTMSACLGSRICGPDEKVHDRVMIECCSSAYNQDTPQWCPGI